MCRLAAQLLVLFSVLLMPLGMSTAASAAQSQQHHEMAGMPMGHCPEDAPEPESAPGIAACTMICAAALPASESAQPLCGPLARPVVDAAEAGELAGVHPEAATPPPRTA